MRIWLLFILSIWVVAPVLATTYYVDYTNGLDTNSGTTKTTAWKRAPGMTGCANTCASATINAGDAVILKGCVTWPNAVFPWAWGFSGNSGSQIYVGVDKTWWDNTVSGCSSTWNRPVLNGQGASANRGNGREDLVTIYTQYVTFDDIELTGHLANPTSNATDIIDLLGGSGPTGSEGVIISNVYIHGWVNPYFCFGTGNIAANASTITNFVPTNCNAGFGSGWVNSFLRVQVYPQGSYWPVQSNNPTVQGISGTNPYTITTNSSTVASACSGCNIQIGTDLELIISGNETGNLNAIVENSVIDGSDTAEVQINPYGDCGLTESNNNVCVASGTAGWRGPQIWLNNVIRFVGSAYVGADGYFGGNLIEYVGRPSIDPTGHTNIWEAVGADAGLNWLFWNNLVRHTNNPNPSTPGGRITVGLSIEASASTGLPSYTFNNVITDTITNGTFEPVSGSGNGTPYIFNNTLDCGPSWSLTYTCGSPVTQGGVAKNNLFITTSSPVIDSSYVTTANVGWSPTTATSAGYTTGQTYIYSPPNSNCTGVTPCTVGTGSSIASLCSTISSIYALAGAACASDTIYGATYNSAAHTAVTGARVSVTHPGTPDVGAYQFVSANIGGTMIGGKVVFGGSVIVH